MTGLLRVSPRADPVPVRIFCGGHHPPPLRRTGTPHPQGEGSYGRRKKQPEGHYNLERWWSNKGQCSPAFWGPEARLSGQAYGQAPSLSPLRSCIARTPSLLCTGDPGEGRGAEGHVQPSVQGGPWVRGVHCSYSFSLVHRGPREGRGQGRNPSKIESRRRGSGS